MEKEETRAVIKYFNIKGLTPIEIKTEMDSTLSNSSPSLKTIRKWSNKFKRGGTSTKDASRSGRPKTATSEEIVRKVQEVVLSDRRLKVREIADASGISVGRTHYILQKVLGMRKLSARWVPRLLTPEQKQKRVSTSDECLKLIQHDPDFYRSFITMDETWLHHYTPETKRQSMQWTGRGELAPKKAKTVPSAGKVMASVFWDARGIIYIDYLQKGRTITGAHYANQLDQLHKAIQQKRPGMEKKKIYFLQDNAPAHTSKVSMAKLKELRYNHILQIWPRLTSSFFPN